MSLLVVRPDGIVVRPGTELTAPLATLDGARVGVLSNSKPNAAALLHGIADELQRRHGTRPGPAHFKNAAVPCEDQVLDGIAVEVEIVLTGTGD